MVFVHCFCYIVLVLVGDVGCRCCLLVVVDVVVEVVGVVACYLLTSFANMMDSHLLLVCWVFVEQQVVMIVDCCYQSMRMTLVVVIVIVTADQQ